MNSRPIPEFTVAQITESIVHFMEKNPDGGLCDHLVFAVQSDALLSGHKPPTDLEIRAVANHLSQYKVQDALIHVDPPTSDDWMHQRIHVDAKRSHAFGRKCRAEFADVLEIRSSSGAVQQEGTSQHDDSFTYIVGQRVTPKQGFSEDWQSECESGIHSFITRIEAENY
ncbi:hypothetical protein UFOVP602_22 [uncultured Caudovirales phage]|uniref:Uncharacterized protein n=1 Tax=uncultured Caudovirales phage TaxID=2100421 RepID=A0A6J5N404_9CAUD|nr:hypothetical protein UFOVP602_22 [uncultured Caudovirales phage]